MRINLKHQLKNNLLFKILLLIILLAAFLIISLKVDLGDHLLSLLLRHESWELDEILLTFFLTYLIVSVMSIIVLFEYFLLSKRKKLGDKVFKKEIEEKELIIREANHRIKNNLSLITSLLNLKLSHSEDTELKKYLLNISSKINSISLIHEKLNHSRDFSEINFSDYLKSLIKGMDETYFTNSGKILLNMEKGDYFIKSEKSVPLGLVISEIITNAVKYGIRDNNDIINIMFSKNTDNVQLIITNTGNIFPENISLDNEDNFGLYLIYSLVKQIDGNIVLEKTPITKYLITF